MNNRKKFMVSMICCGMFLLLTVSNTFATSMPVKQTTYQTLLHGETTGVVLTTDYLGSTGLSFFDTSTYEVTATGIGPTNGDDIVRVYDDKVFVLNRFGYDRIDVFDATDYSYLYNFSTGDGTNPQDIAFISSEKAYVSCYDVPDMLIVNPITGEHLGSINLSTFADDDGIPEMNKMLSITVLGMHRVYVTVQRLDRNNWFSPTDKSYLVEIDSDTDEIIQGIELASTNPVSTPFLDGQYIVVCCAGSWYNYSDGGVERVHLFTNDAEGVYISEQEAGGTIIDYDIYPRRSGLIGMVLVRLENMFHWKIFQRNEVLLISDPTYNTSLLKRDTYSHDIETLYDTTAGYVFPDFALSQKGSIFVCDRTPGSYGLLVFDVKTGEKLTEEPIDTGTLPPATVTLY
jgi:hypothetical protein